MIELTPIYYWYLAKEISSQPGHKEIKFTTNLRSEKKKTCPHKVPKISLLDNFGAFLN